MSPEHARAVAASGYIFLLPLVAEYQRMYQEVIDPLATSFGGGIGAWVHHRHTVSQQSRMSVAHRTSLDSWVWLDLRSEPWVVTMPTAGEGHSSRISDLWGHIAHESVGPAIDTRPALVASRRWMGSVPPDIGPIVRAETAFVRCETNVQTHDQGDLEEIGTIQRSYLAQPLGEPPDRPGVPTPPADGWWPATEGALTTMKFWPVATFALDLVVPNEEDLGTLERLAELGVAQGGRWDAERLDTRVLDAIEAGMDDAITDLMRASGGHGPQPIARSRTDYDRDYFSRAIASLADLVSRSQI